MFQIYVYYKNFMDFAPSALFQFHQWTLTRNAICPINFNVKRDLWRKLVQLV